MGTMNTSEWNHYLMQFRLQSSRRKKRMQHEDLEKKLLQLHKKRMELYRKQRNLGWVNLDPPVMRGYKRYFVLRDDVARSKHAGFFQGILDKINTIQYSDKKAFTAKKRKWGKKIQVERIQKLLEPGEWQFKKLNFSDRERQFFCEVIEQDRKYYWKKYVFVEPWRFVPRVRPNLITKTRVKDATIEKRIKEIDAFLEERDLERKLLRLLHGCDPYSYKEDARRKEKYRFKDKSLQQLLAEAQEGFFSPKFDEHKE